MLRYSIIHHAKWNNLIDFTFNSCSRIFFSENAKFKSEEIKNETTEQKGKNDTKPLKPKVERIKLDEKTLFYSENGLKKFYEIITQNSFKENRSEVTIKNYLQLINRY